MYEAATRIRHSAGSNLRALVQSRFGRPAQAMKARPVSGPGGIVQGFWLSIFSTKAVNHEILISHDFFQDGFLDG